MTLSRQFEDYITALRAYVARATGVPSDRIVFSTPDIAKRKLKERLNDDAEATTLPKTIEVDNFISLYIPFSQTTPSERDSTVQGFYGAFAPYAKSKGYVTNLDLPVTVDIWGGPSQKGGLFIFDTALQFKNYWKRHQTIPVVFRDIKAEDLTNNTTPFDVKPYYHFLLDDETDSSQPEEQYNVGAHYRTTLTLQWQVSFYDIPADSIIGEFNRLIVEYEPSAMDPLSVEVDITK